MGMIQSTHVEDPAQQARLQPWVEMECYQLSFGRQVAQMHSLDLGSQKIVRERQVASVQKLGFAPADLCTVSMANIGTETRFTEQLCEHGGTVFFMPGNAEFDVHVPAGVETTYISFSRTEFLQGARALNPAVWDRPPPGVVPLVTRRSHEFKNIVELCLSAVHAAHLRGETLDPAILRGHLLQTVLQLAAVPEQESAPSSNERWRTLQIGRAVRAFVEGRMDADTLPTVVDICTELGVSERTLQYACHDYIGLSPTVYLRTHRLNNVRAVLAASDPQTTTITEVAMRFGFWHLGRFAGDYRKMFGVTPSETLGS